MNQPSSEKRHYQRVPFIKKAMLTVGNETHEGAILDISIKGALFKPSTSSFALNDSLATLIINLDDDTTIIKMDVQTIPHSSDLIGLKCEHIEIDSFTNLKNTLKYNLGNEKLLDREINALLDDFDNT